MSGGQPLRGEAGEISMELERLSRARDEALLAAGSAMRDATRVTRLLTALNEPAPIALYLDRILSTISELFLADIVILLDPAWRGDFEPMASVGLPEGIGAELFCDQGAGQALDSLRAATTLDMAALRRKPEIEAGLEALGVESVVWIPVQGSLDSRGAMILARCEPLPFTREEMGLLSAMAYRIGLALEQIEQRTQLEQLAGGMRQIAGHTDEAELAKEAVRFFALVMRADAAALVGPGPDGSLVCEEVFGEGGSMAQGLVLPSPLLGEEAVPDPDGILSSVEDSVAGTAADCLHFPCRALLAAPIQLAGRQEKWLLALRLKPICFGAGPRRIAALCSRQIGSLLENAGLYGELQRELAERKRAESALMENERTLRSRQEELQRMVEARDRLFSIIGHDLRGPVGAMCDLLRFITRDAQRPAPEDQSYILSEILQASESIYLLLVNLLEWGKTQRTATELRFQSLDLRPSVEEVLELLSSQAGAKGVELVDEVEPSLRLAADVDSLQTILRNLVSNAVKFTNPGGRVTISACAEEDRVRVTVADTGVGMDAEALDTAFDFAKRRSTRGTRGEKGIGLGLILCRELVEKNGASISFESRVGQGTEVSLSFRARAEG